MKTNFKDVSMVNKWKSLKQGALAHTDVLAITQVMEFVAHAGTILEGECKGVPRNDAPHLWGGVDKCREAIDLLGFILDYAAESDVDTKLRGAIQKAKEANNAGKPTLRHLITAQRLAASETEQEPEPVVIDWSIGVDSDVAKKNVEDVLDVLTKGV